MCWWWPGRCCCCLLCVVWLLLLCVHLPAADSGLLQNLMLPGDAGDVTMLPNGDVLTVGTAVHHGALLVVWTQDASRAAAPAVVAQYYEYMQGIKKWVENLRKREMGEPDGPVGEIELPPGYDLKGLYDQRCVAAALCLV